MNKLQALLATSLSLLLLAPGARAAPPTETEFVEGLADRRLFSLAELACRNQLARDDLTPRQQATWTVQWMRMLGLRAAHAMPGSQAPLWQQAHEVAGEFETRFPQHPRGILVALQDALNYLAEGELTRLEAEVAPHPEESLERARDIIRAATRRLEALEKQATELLTGARQNADAAESLQEQELFALQNNVRFQLARAQRNQGLCYASDSTDRVAALSAAVRQLEKTLSQLQADDPLTWQVYLDLARCHRLLGDLPQAQRALIVPLSEAAPVAVRLEARAEQARVLIAAGDAPQALKELEQARQQQGDTSPELACAELEAMLVLWQAALQEDGQLRARDWQRKVAATAQRIEERFGPYWGRRAKLGQLTVAAADGGDGNVDMLETTADELFLQKDFDGAIRTYERGAELARAVGDWQKATSLEYKAALIEQKLERYDAAAGRLQRLALEQPSQSEASQMHLLAVWNAAQVVRADPDTVDRYQSMLREHLEKWPTQQAAHQVRRWLGDLYVSQGNMEGAVQAYRGITADSELHLAAVTDAAACWQRWLRQLERDGRPTAAIVADAIAFFDAILFGSGPEPRWPERWSPAQLAAALATTRLRIAHVPDGLADAQKVLEAALENAPDDAQAWRQEANSLLIVALAGQPGREQEALALLQRQKMTAADLLQLIDNLTACATNAPAELKPALARVQLAVLEKLDAEQPSLDASQRLRTEQLRADAFQLLGKTAEALQIYRRLAAQHRDDRTVQLQLAQLLLEAQDEQTLTEAVTQWQNVARRLRPNSDDWYRARYSLALALYKRNRPAEGQEPPDRVLAAQRLRYLQSTSQVEQTRWGPQVAELLRRCEGK